MALGLASRTVVTHEGAVEIFFLADTTRKSLTTYGIAAIFGFCRKDYEKI
jgi:hypothetical protein